MPRLLSHLVAVLRQGSSLGLSLGALCGRSFAGGGHGLREEKGEEEEGAGPGPRRLSAKIKTNRICK